MNDAKASVSKRPVSSQTRILVSLLVCISLLAMLLFTSRRRTRQITLELDLSGPVLPLPPDPSDEYVGSTACRDCHKEIADTFRRHPMSNSITLVNQASEIEDYLEDLKRFTIMRKKDPFDKTDAVMDATFNYDFEAIRDADFQIDPNSIPRTDSPIEFHFFLDEQQKNYISNQVVLYATTPTGLGRMMLRSNLKLIFRSFARSSSVNQVVSQTG